MEKSKRNKKLTALIRVIKSRNSQLIKCHDSEGKLLFECHGRGYPFRHTGGRRERKTEKGKDPSETREIIAATLEKIVQAVTSEKYVGKYLPLSSPRFEITHSSMQQNRYAIHLSCASNISNILHQHGTVTSPDRAISDPAGDR